VTGQGLVVTHTIHEKGVGDVVQNVDEWVRYVGGKVDRVIDNAHIMFSYSSTPSLLLPRLDGEEPRVALQHITSYVDNKNRYEIVIS
jgi:hypothetical protein